MTWRVGVRCAPSGEFKVPRANLLDNQRIENV